MSNKSGISSQVISLPQGGGALQGIGESFTPDLFTGTGNLTIPLALPAGRNGFQPDLSLVYSTGKGNSPFGLGWSINLPEVCRQGSKGQPRYEDDMPDTFLLSGMGELVPVAGPDGQRYRPRVEGSFARIERIQAGGQDFWRVHSRDGMVNLYGATGPDLAVIADPDNVTRIYCWKLCETSDPFGNRIVYQYRRDRAAEGPHTWDQLYVERIQYVDFDSGGPTRFLISVSFEYDDRPDAFSAYSAGFEVRTRLRCKRMVVHTHPDEEHLVRTVEFTYLDERVAVGELPSEQLPQNGVSLLSRVQVIGHDGNQVEKLPPLEFGYTRFRPEQRRFLSFQAEGNTMPTQSLDDPDFELVDLFGRGLPDIVQMNGVIQFWRNLGGGKFDRPRTMPEIPSGIQLNDPGVRFADMNGNGRADLMALKLGGYFPMSFQGRWSREGFVQYSRLPSFDLASPDVRLMDLDGDGVVDALRTGTNFELFFNDPKIGWERVESRSRGSLADFPDLNFSDPHVKLASFNGSHLQSFVLIKQGRIDYWSYLGNGHWAPRITMANSPIFPKDPSFPGEGFDPRRVLLGDMDGDGLDDLLYLERNRVTIWINECGNGWSKPIVVEGTPAFDSPDAVRLADMLGNGIAGILWTSDQTNPGQANYRFLDMTNGEKPYLLSEINNNMGALTRVEYRPSTDFYHADFENSRTRWKTPLPFAVHVVARVETIDELSGGKLTSEYKYHHGYWDGDKREFRGFGLVEQVDSETFEQFNQPSLNETGRAFQMVEQDHYSSPVLTRTWFYLGAVGDEFKERTELNFSAEYWPEDPPVFPPMAVLADKLVGQVKTDALNALSGSVLRSEVYALDASPLQERPYTITEVQYGLREEQPPNPAEDRERIFFPHRLSQRVTQWERGREPMSNFTFSAAYDIYGQPSIETSIAVPRGRDFHQASSAGEPYLASFVQTTYAQQDNEQAYIVDRVASVTNYEVVNDGGLALLDLQRAILGGNVTRNVISATLNYYDGPAFEGLPLREIGVTGATVRSETLVLTPEILQSVSISNEAPPYWMPNGTPAWTSEYPQAFREALPPLAGYRFDPGDPQVIQGYYAARLRQAYDFQLHENGRGMPLIIRSPLGADTRLDYDAFRLKPIRTTDLAGLETTAQYDMRTLRPSLVTDANGNRTSFAFTPLGLLASTAVMGKPGEAAGDDPGTGVIEPSSHLKYDFLAFMERHQPISVHTIQRIHRASEKDVALPERAQTIETAEYSDGFGRLLQTRTQAEDVLFADGLLPASQADIGKTTATVVGSKAGKGEIISVVVSGWQVYNNKGKVVAKFEPFFATGWDFQTPDQAPLGERTQVFYDPRGQVIRTVYPDGSEERVIFGVPGSIAIPNLSNPENFEPTPWEAYRYDVNDNAGRTLPADPQAGRYEHCWNTPTSVTVDALGRAVISTVRNRAPRANSDGSPPPIVLQVTRSTFDLQGNPLTLCDPLNRVVFSCIYDLHGNKLRTETLDAGLRCVALDAAGNQIERRDGRGALVLQAFDQLNRISRVWARDGESERVTLREYLEYGDAPDQDPAEREDQNKHNRLGRLHRHYDEAGRLTFETYDFQGNLLEKSRQVIGSEAILSVFPKPGDPEQNWTVSAFRIDWQPPAGMDIETLADKLLDPDVYVVSAAYNGQGQPRRLIYPSDSKGQRSVLEPRYNKAGLLERVTMDGAIMIEHIAYNARRQRLLMAYGNNIMTRYSYEPRLFRLARLRTERFAHPPGQPFSFQPTKTGMPLQDITYQHDLAGNPLSMNDVISLPNSKTEALARQFVYDACYQLLSASGLECAAGPGPIPGSDELSCQDLTATRIYSEEYIYDLTGSLIQLRHHAGSDAFTRVFQLANGTNKLQEMISGDGAGNRIPYTYDASGNILSESTSRQFEWDHNQRLRVFRIQAGEAEPSVHVDNLYDASGQRVIKLARKQGGSFEETIYIDEIFERHRQVRLNQSQENDTLHVMDQHSRVALIRRGKPFKEDGGPAVQYHFGDHLGSSQLVVGGVQVSDSEFISREEYTPYGVTTFGSFSRKRYRFNGREREEESGLNYHRARFYAPWAARWISPDPAGFVDGLNCYCYSRNQPLRFSDAAGTSAWDWIKSAAAYTYDFHAGAFAKPWQWTVKSANLAESAWKKASGRLRRFADNLWGWAKEHPYLATAAAVTGAIGLASASYYVGASVWNWVLAPAIRIGTNALMGYAIGGITGAVLGAVAGAVHGFAMAYAKSYNWKRADSWAAFILDNTWSLFNSFVGSFFASANVIGGEVDKSQSEGSTNLYFKDQWFPPYDTTFPGNVTVGTKVPKHELVHVWQARLLGPLYVPAVALGFEVATVLPYWLLFDHCKITGFNTYFTHGVYPGTLHEAMAYGLDSHSSPC